MGATRLKHVLTLLLVPALAEVDGLAATFHVAPLGSDANPGTRQAKAGKSDDSDKGP
jgi:hypothetical protein